ncbi:hypothetical protein CFN17_11685, partial [Arthrobacter sp. PM3]
GTAKVGSTLTAVPGIWGPAPVALAYQWKANGSAIIGATGAAYTAVGGDTGKTITVTVTGTKAGYSTVSKTSAPTAAIANGSLSTTPVPTITGTAKVGSTLTAVPGIWGPAPVALAYQWKANGSAIIGATGAAYTAVGGDTGKTITVTVTGTKAGYSTVSKTSAPTAAIANGPLSTTPVPTITGVPAVGSTLTAASGVWGPAPVTLRYQWYRSGVAILGATSPTYVPVAEDLGAILTVKVTGSKSGYTTFSRTSAATAAVVKGSLIRATPTVTGTAKVGSTLTANSGVWGPAPVTLRYQWYRSGVAITGATSPTYVPVPEDLGAILTVKVTGSKSGYTTFSRTSAATAAVVKGSLIRATPTVTGTAKVGSTLTANSGVWGPAPVTLRYQWYRAGVAITGANAATYKPTATDVAKTLTVKVTGSKPGYTTFFRTSVPTTAVAK